MADSLKSELEALKAQVAEMSRRVVGEERPTAEAVSSETSPLDEVRKVAEGLDTRHLVEQAAEYLKGVGEDVQESGYLAGRVMGR
jgi:hypothetical protein